MKNQAYSHEKAPITACYSFYSTVVQDTQKDTGACAHPQHVFWTKLLAKLSLAITVNQIEFNAFLWYCWKNEL